MLPLQACQEVVPKEDIYRRIFWSDAFGNNIYSIAWKSHRTKRIVNSTLAAEAMALIEASGQAYWIRCIINEIFPTIAISVMSYRWQNTVIML